MYMGTRALTATSGSDLLMSETLSLNAMTDPTVFWCWRKAPVRRPACRPGRLKGGLLPAAKLRRGFSARNLVSNSQEASMTCR